MDLKESQYFYNLETDTYYSKLAEKMISFANLKTKLEVAKSNLSTMIAKRTELNSFFNLLGMETIDDLNQLYLNNLNEKQKELLEIEKKIQEAIKNKYFPENLQWTNFSEDILKKIYEMLSEKLAEVEERNIEKLVEEKMEKCSDKELQYIKKYLASSKNQQVNDN